MNKVKFIYFCALEKYLHNEIAAILLQCGAVLRISFVFLLGKVIEINCSLRPATLQRIWNCSAGWSWSWS